MRHLDPQVDAIDLATTRRRSERWQERALSAERVWAGVAYALGIAEHLREQDRIGLLALIEAHREYLAREWLAEPKAPASSRRVTDQ